MHPMVLANNLHEKPAARRPQPSECTHESKFGAFGKEYSNPNNSGKRNDDLHGMGDQELQIVDSGCCSNDNHGDSSRADENLHHSESSFSSIHCPLKNRDVNNTSVTSDGFDVCLEYGYRYEFTEEDDSDDHSVTNGPADAEAENTSLIAKLRMLPTGGNVANGNTGNTRKKDNEVNYNTYILGKTYHPINDYHAKRDDESNLFWITYRCDFIEIKPYGITSDAGWGCMLRSAQMLLAQVLRIHWKGRDWRAERSLKMKRENGFVRDLMTWLADYPSPGTECDGGQSSFSLHNMVAAGMARYDILPGEWFGPGTACHVLRDLVNLHSRSLKLVHDTNSSDNDNAGASASASASASTNASAGSNKHRDNGLKVYVAPEGVIYQSDLRDLLIKQKDTKPKFDKMNQHELTREKESKGRGHKKEKVSKIHHPLYESPISSAESEQIIKEEWDASLLILIPLRLGLKEFNTSYKVPLAHVLSFPQSVGFVGGSPRHALWFYGANSDGNKVFGLDPHTVQRAPRRQMVHPDAPGQKAKYEIVFSDEYLRSINCPNPSTIKMARLDPSLALGFYCRDREDYDRFCDSLEFMRKDKKFASHPELFTMAEAKPNYSADVSSAMMDMMMNSSTQFMEGDDLDRSNNADDDDEYILL